MRPLCLRGHERPITKVIYNEEGDLLFTSSKDGLINVWYSTNGERLGSYGQTKGVVWDIDVSWDTKHLVGASASSKCTLWDVETGTELKNYGTTDIVRTCAFSYCGNKIVYATSGAMSNKQSVICVYDVRAEDPIWVETVPNSEKVVRKSKWGTLDEFIVTAHKDGSVCQWDTQSHSVVRDQEVHHDEITDLQSDHNMIFLLTSSKDHTAKLLDIETLEILKTYKTERPVNSGCISPRQDHVLLGGGQEAHAVTTTAIEAGKFDSRLFHMIFEEEFGSIKGHFGPVNSLAFHPDGIGFASGGEDGLIMLYEFDEDYLEGENRNDF